MACYSIEPRTRKYVKGYGFLLFERNLSNKYRKQLLDTASKKVIHKTAEATCEFIVNKNADAIAKWYNNEIVKSHENLQKC